MKKVLQKIMLLVAVITVISHSILPHHHHEEFPAATQQHHDEEQPAGFTHHDDDKDDHHGIFSFAQLDENFVPVKAENKNFELPITDLPELIVIYLSDNFPVNTQTHFGWYKEYPPPDKIFPSSSRRGPPTV